MSTQTTNLGLIKPALTDNADIAVLNQNADKIDEAVPFMFGIESGKYGYYKGREFVEFGESGGGGGILPPEYRQIEYIQSHGTEYILTGKTLIQIGCVTSDFVLPNPIGDFIALAGIHTAAAQYASYCHLNAPWSPTLYLPTNYFGHEIRVQYNVAAGDKVHISSIIQNHKNLFMSVNGAEAYYTSLLSKTLDNATQVAIFGLYTGSDIFQSSKTKLYNFRMYGPDMSIIRDFVPCYRISDGEVGLYDIVGKSFFANQGTGAFDKGPDVTEET